MNAATIQSLVMADELARAGVREIVVAPGARSGPLAQALHQTASKFGQRLHTHFDERAAGFLALGLAKISRRPAAVVCTSGSAIANLHPAVLEARHSHVPMVVLTADRPPELRDTGTSQTTDQIKVYGSAVLLFAEVGTLYAGPDKSSPHPSANNYWRSLICRAVASAARGPVHLNVPLREPLTFEPSADAMSDFAGRPDGKAWVDITTHHAPVASHSRIEVPARSKGVVIVGDDAAEAQAAVAFAKSAGWPLLAEPQSNARLRPNTITAYRYLLGHPGTRRQLMPEIVISVGRPGVAREVLALLYDVAEHIVVDPHPEWADPTRTAHRLASELPIPTGPAAHPSWLRSWKDADTVARTALDGFLDASGFNEPRLMRDVLKHIPDGALCFIGSSMPIRDAEVTMPSRPGVRMICNRGLAGIDGAVSTAIGAALSYQASGGGKAYAVMGDLTFLHDSTGLMGCAHNEYPDLTIVVSNNRGGGIFSLVGHTADAVGFDDLFAATHRVDLGGLAVAAGWSHHMISHSSELTDGLLRTGPQVLEVRTDRQANAKLHKKLKEHIDRALADAVVV